MRVLFFRGVGDGGGFDGVGVEGGLALLVT